MKIQLHRCNKQLCRNNINVLYSGNTGQGVDPVYRVCPAPVYGPELATQYWVLTSTDVQDSAVELWSGSQLTVVVVVVVVEAHISAPTRDWSQGPRPPNINFIYLLPNNTHDCMRLSMEYVIPNKIQACFMFVRGQALRNMHFLECVFSLIYTNNRAIFR